MTNQDDQSVLYTNQNPARVRVHLKRTINLEDYNSLSFGVDVEQDVPEGESVPGHIKKLSDNIRKLMAAELMKHDNIVLDD